MPDAAEEMQMDESAVGMFDKGDEEEDEGD